MSNIINNKSVEIRLPYFKQGDDLDSCIFKNSNGKIDVKKTLEAHINLLDCAANILKQINNKIPLDNEMEISGNTHFIELTGDEKIINELLKEKLVEEFEDFSSEENESDSSSGSSSDSDSSDSSSLSDSDTDMVINN